MEPQSVQVDAGKVIAALQAQIGQQAVEIATLNVIISDLRDDHARLLEAAHGEG